MNAYHNKIPPRNRSRDPLERRMDRWVETGRQFVDGVSGNRPGQRRSGKPISSGLDSVGRWVGDKIDWFLEEEDEWMEPWQLENHHKQMNSPSKKRPLEAISLRGTKSISPSRDPKNKENQEDVWPEDAAFQVNRWTRSSTSDLRETTGSADNSPESSKSSTRPLPRSSRRRGKF